MGLAELELTNFRTFSNYRLEFDTSAVTVFLSPNGTGKTSVLEAVFALATGRSFRTTSAGDLLRTGSDSASAHAIATSGVRRLELEIHLVRGARAVTKRLRINKQKPASFAELYEAFPVTVFTPEGVDMVRREPAGRRDYLTTLAMNLEPRLSDVVERFERVLKQRNALLRSLGGELPTAQQRDEFVVWDDEFVVAGQELIAARERTLEPLAPVVAHFYESISGGRGSVTLAYEPSFDDDLASALRLAQRADFFRGHSTVGPHRDDMSIFLDGRDARRQASQGEQRSMALALLLAGDALVRERRSITPLLMLDDVFSELDPVRSSRLLSLLPVGQTLVTTASPIPHELDPAVVVDLTVPS